ncbi:CerR family C-terminal domain-containing protein [Pseudooceanicola sp. CBS1P-1]|uniref:CerR family C-terminal domain-containing protein n=1 Tax=Pseudooceanicola albus TaxID=2692189 RepID=A0A6L7G9S8_9RHOB|nr:MULTISPECIES: CerR family C-terminal domain-containing protein [Pseudooceanicola]MBT9385828.1 CerR family C-terminal domain-containing protein [Pseudooceanicola endophyticus]MXN20060.1 CerR family C-terminal domain-containing protein [Pseudooceanicola albus]
MTDQPAPDATPARLIAAGLVLFGQEGYAATSTRAIAKRAGANISAIAYHFGGKAGLHDACLSAVTERIDGAAGPALEGPLPPEVARQRLHAMLEAITRFLVTAPAAPEIAGFVLRQMQEPGDAADRLYERLFERRHRELCELWSTVTGQPAESEAVCLSCFTLIGQIVYFRIGARLISRRLGWDSPGPDQAPAIAATLACNLDAMLDRALAGKDTR